MELSPAESTKKIRRLGNMTFKQRLEEQELFSLERGILRGDLILILKYMKGGRTEEGDRPRPPVSQKLDSPGDRLFSVATKDRQEVTVLNKGDSGGILGRTFFL